MPYDNPLLEKSLKFASRIVKLYQYLLKEKHESIISKQIIRSGTSIGANANEAIYGISKADFIHQQGRLHRKAANIPQGNSRNRILASIACTVGIHHRSGRQFPHQ